MDEHERRGGLRAWSRSTGLPVSRQLSSGLGGAVAVVALTFVLAREREALSLTIVFLLYLAAVVVVSAVGGSIVGTATAVVAFLAVNFFFTEPRHTLNVADPERLAELVIFLAVAGTVATLGDTATRRRGVIEARTTEAAELSAANDLRTALLRAVSHDLRTPLATAKLATSSLRAADVELDVGAREELAALADEQVDRLISIVENLLDAGRLQAGALRIDVQPIRLDEVVNAAVATIREDQRDRILVVAADDLPLVLADAALLERVIANLVTNALAADPGGVRVEVTARGNHPVDQPFDGGVGAVVAVVDHGPGLRPEQLDAALRPFHRFEDSGGSGGVGLGLPICVGFCEAMGARLEFGRTDGGGLTASIRLSGEEVTP